MKTEKFTKSEQQMRKEIAEVVEKLGTLLFWHREMAIEEDRPLFNSVADIIFESIEKLNKV